MDTRYVLNMKKIMKMGRKFIGVDISEGYCATARCRLAEVSTSLF